MDVLDRIEALIEESRAKQGDAREQIYKTLGRIFDLVLDLDEISLAVDHVFSKHRETITGAYPQNSDQNTSC